MSKIRYGQIGVGHAHANKISVYRKSEDYEVVGVCEPNPELRVQAEKSPHYKGLRFLTQEQLFNVPGLKVVGIETEVRDLLKTARAAIDAGFHIHLDKPAGESLRDYRSLLNAATHKKLTVQMGYMFRFSPAVKLMRQVLKEGWLGDLFEVHTVMSKVVDPRTRKQLGEYPGGIMFELGCHVIDLVIGVLGRPSSIQSFAQRVGKFDDRLVDNMLATFLYPKAMATVKSSALEVEGFSRRHFVVCGTEGTLHIQPLDAPHVTLSLSRQRGRYSSGTQTIHFGNYPRYVGDAADLAKIIRKEKCSDFPPEHDLAVQDGVLRASGLMPDA